MSNGSLSFVLNPGNCMLKSTPGFLWPILLPRSFIPITTSSTLISSSADPHLVFLCVWFRFFALTKPSCSWSLETRECLIPLSLLTHLSGVEFPLLPCPLCTPLGIPKILLLSSSFPLHAQSTSCLSMHHVPLLMHLHCTHSKSDCPMQVLSGWCREGV